MCTFCRVLCGAMGFAPVLTAMFFLACCLAGPRLGQASHLFSFDTTLSSDYLLIARDSVNGNTDVDVSNFELGAIKAPVPSNDQFLNDDFPLPGCATCGGSGGPTLAGAVPDFVAGVMPVAQGIGGHGNIAVMDPEGEFNLQNTGVYADPDIGIRVAGPNSTSINKSSNSFFNDPAKFPNTFDVPTQSGVEVDATDAGDGSPFADATTRIDHPGDGGFNAGVTYGFDHSGLATEIYDAKADIIALFNTGTLDVSGGNAGELDTSSTAIGVSLSVTGGNSLGGVDAVLTLAPGLNVVDIITGGNDFAVSNANFVIDGPQDSAVVFRLPGNDNMLVDNSNVMAGGGGIEGDSTLFFSEQTENDTHFNMKNVIINGVAFWSFGTPNNAELGTSIVINNAQGCTQLLADKITLSDVRLTHCLFGTDGEIVDEFPAPVPEPPTWIMGITGIALLGYAAMKRRRE